MSAPNQSNPRRLTAALLAALAVLLVVAACDGARPTPTPTAERTGDPLGLHAYPELEARLPQTIGGRNLLTVSLAAHPDRQDPKTLEVLERLNKTANDLQLANGDLGDDFDFEVGAMRIIGAPGNDIVAAFRAVDEADPDSTAIYTPITLAGKNVTARTIDRVSTFLYGVDDIMFIIRGDQALVEEALGLLP